MRVGEVLGDGFGRVSQAVLAALDGLTPQDLARRPDPDANSIGWLVWHLTRVQDDHLADAFDREQLWLADEWVVRFSLPLPARDTGYGHHRDEVAGVRVPSTEVLRGYFEAVHARTLADVVPLTEPDLDRIVDTSWDPPVTLGVRLISVVADDLQHAGQAAYLRGLLRRTVG
ncbi:MAG TPA: DUF664 domain-containing protein [Kineosporiaceae bacterium]|nr:DUF664 domain-containing protein [Kineosporiaceae bacterium]